MTHFSKKPKMLHFLSALAWLGPISLVKIFLNLWLDHFLVIVNHIFVQRLRGHSFSTYSKFSEKLTFLKP